MPRLYVLALQLILVSSLNAQTAHWKKLFNGKDFSGWNKYLSTPLDSAGNKWNNTQLGYNNDPQNIFTIVRDSGENIIRVSGQTWGAISTREEFSNYHLQLKFKWGKYSWAGKKNKPKDSGLLYHGTGEPVYSGWMESHEFQIEENDCGDYWTVGKVKMNIRSDKGEGIKYIYDPNGEWKTFGDSGYNWCHRPTANEAPVGGWNTLDLYCFGDTSVHVVNGEVVMVLYNSRHEVNGQLVPLTGGKIQLQSEGAELYFKDVKIQGIDFLPKNLLVSK